MIFRVSSSLNHSMNIYDCIVGLLHILLQAYTVTTHKTIALKSICACILRISLTHKYNSKKKPQTSLNLNLGTTW